MKYSFLNFGVGCNRSEVGTLLNAPSKWGYPPDNEPRATDTVLEQAELYAGELV